MEFRKCATSDDVNITADCLGGLDATSFQSWVTIIFIELAGKE